MSHLNLEVKNPISETGQYVQDHDGNQSKLSLSTDNIGIGTENADQRLTVKGGGIGFDHNSADKKLYSPKDGVLEWMTHEGALKHGFAVSHQADKRVYLNVKGDSYFMGGNVGIGTKEPINILHVKGDGEVGLFESITSQAFLKFQTTEGEDYRVEIANRPGGRLALWTRDTGDVLNITKAGNVGIGTTAPINILHVKGDGEVGLFESTNSQAFVKFQTTEGEDYRVEIANRPGGRLALWTRDKGDVLNITKAGDVGIGTQTPGAKLEVAGTIRATGLDVTGPESFNGANMKITGLPNASTAPPGADLEIVVVDKATGKLYMQ